jgi:hypothetical protein
MGCGLLVAGYGLQDFGCKTSTPTPHLPTPQIPRCVGSQLGETDALFQSRDLCLYRAQHAPPRFLSPRTTTRRMAAIQVRLWGRRGDNRIRCRRPRGRISYRCFRLRNHRCVRSNSSPSDAGVYGYNTGSSGLSPGMWGYSPNGLGVYGQSTSGTGLQGKGIVGVFGQGHIGVEGSSDNSGAGVYGTSDKGTGVWGSSQSGFGVYGNSKTGGGVQGDGNPGVAGKSSDGYGVSGSSEQDIGVYGSGMYAGVRGEAPNGVGVQGKGDVGLGGDGAIGVAGTGTSAGVTGISSTKTGYGVAGSNDIGAAGVGLYGGTMHGIGVEAVGNQGVGLRGTSQSPRHSATSSGPGIQATSKSGRGGTFAGKTASVRLVPSNAATHPANGRTGDLFVDNTGRLWYCQQGGNPSVWKQIE